MSRVLRLVWAVVVAGMVCPVPSWGQTLATTTTTAAAMTASANTINLTSATGVVATQPRTKLWVNRELMEVVALSGTIATVRRGLGSSHVTAHDSGDKVTILNETALAQFTYAYDPDYNAACTRGTGQARVLPWINTATGIVWVCRAGGAWRGTNIHPLTDDSDQTFTG